MRQRRKELSLNRPNLLACLIHQSLKTVPLRRGTIGARQQNVHQPLMDTVVVAVFLKLTHAPAITGELGHATALVM